MSINIIYKNRFDELITIQQKELSDYYKEETYINGRLKRKRTFFEMEILFDTLYVYPDENLAAELATLTDPQYEYSIAKDYQISGDYSIWSFFSYQGSTLDTEYVKHVYDSWGRLIANATYDSNHNILRPGLKKYYLTGKVLYYNGTEVDVAYHDDDNIIFDFSEGSLIIDVDFDLADDPFTTISRFLDQWQDLLPFMTPDVLNYFTNMEPLVPNVAI